MTQTLSSGLFFALYLFLTDSNRNHCGMGLFWYCAFVGDILDDLESNFVRASKFIFINGHLTTFQGQQKLWVAGGGCRWQVV